MKRTTIGFVVTILAVAFFGLFNTVSATFDADSTYWFPKTDIAPVIDGELDPVWYGVHNLTMTKLVTGYTVDDWFDIWGSCKLLWDDANLYIFLTTHDDVNQPEATNTYEQDGAEFYFDADNSKMETYDTLDDIQIRFNTDWVPDGVKPETGFGTTGEWPSAPFDRTGINWAFLMTDLGYQLEICIPLVNLQMEGVPGWDFGFDIQMNDNDDAARTAEWKWWSTSGNSWQNPSLFGNVAMSGFVTGEATVVAKAQAAPEIDGILDAAWEVAPDYSSNTYVTSNAYVPDETWSVYERVDDWNDMDFDFRVMWDTDFFYFFANVRDDMIGIEVGGDWEKDSFELYFDGDNSKNDYTNDGVGYDSNDKQLRRVYTDAPTDANYACDVTDMGWTMEWQIPYADLGWVPEEGLVIGFDIQFNDQDDPALVRSGMARWWGSDNNSWLDASMFGTMVLGGPVGVKENDAVATTYKLAQNYPNPFNPSTTIAYSVASRGNVTLTVYDMLGKEVANLVNEVKAAGEYTVNFNAGNLPSGVYFYKLNNGSQVLTQKMMLIK
ncbi:MAG TPA: sugar-binding protein [bacterium]|nr:sugar-binding protein [bacterium]HPN42165.1 sugar-binding protein [bacterium]